MEETAPDYLLHTRIVETAINRDKRAVQIWGGKGTGKTYILEVTARKLRPFGDVSIVRGRETGAASDLRAALQSGNTVLIDDLDAMFTEDVVSLLQDRTAKTPRIVFTSVCPPDVTQLVERGVYEQAPLELLRQWSDVTQQFHPQEIAPWPHDWRTRVAEFVRGVASEEFRNDHVFVAEWTTAVVHLTGGHPKLLDTALAEVRRLFGSAENADAAAFTASARSSSERRRRIYAHVEEVLFSSQAFRSLRHVIRDMKEKAGVAAAFLAERAKEPSLEFDASVEFARFLTDSGIVRRNVRSRRLAINGDLLRRLLGNDEARLPRIVLTPSDETPDERGRVKAEIGGEESSVDLRGAAWRIVRQLDAHRDRIVSVSQLISGASVDHAGVRSGIQRLKAELEHAGIEGVVENVWGQGYQISDFPLIAIREAS